MVIRVYVSGISGNKEVKKRQQRVLLILDSKNVNYEVIDIAEPGAEEAKDFMQTNATSLGGTISDPSPRHPLPPQIFNDETYCGDYDQFDMANEIDEMENFLKLQVAQAAENVISSAEIKLKNGEVSPDETDASKGGESVAADSEVTENAVAAGQEAVEAEEISKDEVKGAEGSEEVEQINEETKANEDSKEEGDSKKEEEAEVAEESEEPRNEVAEGGAEPEEENEEDLVAKKDEEKADA